MFTLFVHTLCSMNFSEMYYDGETFMMLTHEYKYQHFFIKRVRLVYLWTEISVKSHKEATWAQFCFLFLPSGMLNNGDAENSLLFCSNQFASDFTGNIGAQKSELGSTSDLSWQSSSSTSRRTRFWSSKPLLAKASNTVGNNSICGIMHIQTQKQHVQR